IAEIRSAAGTRQSGELLGVALSGTNIYSSGYTTRADGAGDDFAMQCFTSAGNSCTGFSQGGTAAGRAIFDIGPTDRWYTVETDSSGMLGVVGVADGEFAISRHLPGTGAIDPAFNSGGFHRGLRADSTPYAFTYQADGKFVIASQADGPNINLDRADSNGNVDASFSMSASIAPGADRPTAVAIQSDSKIVVGGWTENTGGAGGRDFFVARFLVDDRDDDGILDALDNCPDTANAGQLDTDGDTLGDACDPDDDDNDGVLDASDNCPDTANANQLNADGDAQGDACDPDDDNDGVLDAADNCALVSNADQLDTDGDSQGNVCDPDDDNDGVLDAADNCPFVVNPDQADREADGIGDACEGDRDSDTVTDDVDNCPATPNADQQNTDGDSRGDACDDDDDNDGVLDAADNCALVSNADQQNTDGDSRGNACDDDDDNDTVLDAADNCPLVVNPGQADLDANGTGTACDLEETADAGNLRPADIGIATSDAQTAGPDSSGSGTGSPIPPTGKPEPGAQPVRAAGGGLTCTLIRDSSQRAALTFKK
ncbi:MAG: thrombospondin type 3 repeat-containing protein, partial [Deltaproteobacteria bacterium]|nr:thrombospondin type 3 repeat-containing protein [Deltaproteobacteria bacterium]